MVPWHLKMGYNRNEDAQFLISDPQDHETIIHRRISFSKQIHVR